MGRDYPIYNGKCKRCLKPPLSDRFRPFFAMVKPFLPPLAPVWELYEKGSFTQLPPKIWKIGPRGWVETTPEFSTST